MEMRFELYQSPQAEPAPGRRSRTSTASASGTSRTRASPASSSRSASAASLRRTVYRAVVRFRWRDAPAASRRRRASASRRRARSPTPPGPRRPQPSARRGRAPRRRRRDLRRRRREQGQRPRGPVQRRLRPSTASSQPPQRVGPLAAGQRVPVTFQAPRCAAGSTVRVTVDAAPRSPSPTRRTTCSSGAARWAARLRGTMKTEIHPDYVESHVRCTCGNEFMTRSTESEIHVEICSNCHPFYTGKQKLVDTGGRVDRFRRRAAKRAAGIRPERPTPWRPLSAFPGPRAALPRHRRAPSPASGSPRATRPSAARPSSRA